MKAIYKNLFYAAMAAFLCLFLAVPANAQRTSSGGGGGGGGSHPSGGGGGGSSASSARPSGGGGGSASVSRPSGGGGGGGASVSRPSTGGSSVNRGGNVSRPSVGVVQRSPGVQQRQSPAYVYHNGAIQRNPSQSVAIRGNNGYPQRVGVASSLGYRTSPRIGYGRGSNSYWGTHGYYHYNHGYYNTYYLASLGYQCRILPYGYYPFFWGDYQYFFCNGLFYTYDNDQYTVVEPPVGAEITTLPENTQSIVINGQQYYESNGVYYQQVTKDDGTVVYTVAGKDGVLNTDQQVQDNQPQGPQLGDIVTQLPQDCRKIKLNGEKLYVSSDGIYYKEQVDANGTKTYKIVGLPSDEPDQKQN